MEEATPRWVYPSKSVNTDPYWERMRSVACEVCGAPPGAYCMTTGGKSAGSGGTHARRIREAKRAS